MLKAFDFCSSFFMNSLNLALSFKLIFSLITFPSTVKSSSNSSSSTDAAFASLESSAIPSKSSISFSDEISLMSYGGG